MAAFHRHLTISLLISILIFAVTSSPFDSRVGAPYPHNAACTDNQQYDAFKLTPSLSLSHTTITCSVGSTRNRILFLLQPCLWGWTWRHFWIPLGSPAVFAAAAPTELCPSSKRWSLDDSENFADDGAYTITGCTVSSTASPDVVVLTFELITDVPATEVTIKRSSFKTIQLEFDPSNVLVDGPPLKLLISDSTFDMQEGEGVSSIIAFTGTGPLPQGSNITISGCEFGPFPEEEGLSFAAIYFSYLEYIGMLLDVSACGMAVGGAHIILMSSRANRKPSSIDLRKGTRIILRQATWSGDFSGAHESSVSGITFDGHLNAEDNSTVSCVGNVFSSTTDFVPESGGPGAIFFFISLVHVKESSGLDGNSSMLFTGNTMNVLGVYSVALLRLSEELKVYADDSVPSGGDGSAVAGQPETLNAPTLVFNGSNVLQVRTTAHDGSPYCSVIDAGSGGSLITQGRRAHVLIEGASIQYALEGGFDPSDEDNEDGSFSPHIGFVIVGSGQLKIIGSEVGVELRNNRIDVSGECGLTKAYIAAVLFDATLFDLDSDFDTAIAPLPENVLPTLHIHHNTFTVALDNMGSEHPDDTNPEGIYGELILSSIILKGSAPKQGNYWGVYSNTALIVEAEVYTVVTYGYSFHSVSCFHAEGYSFEITLRGILEFKGNRLSGESWTAIGKNDPYADSRSSDGVNDVVLMWVSQKDVQFNDGLYIMAEQNVLIANTSLAGKPDLAILILLGMGASVMNFDEGSAIALRQNELHFAGGGIPTNEDGAGGEGEARPFRSQDDDDAGDEDDNPADGSTFMKLPDESGYDDSSCRITLLKIADAEEIGLETNISILIEGNRIRAERLRVASSQPTLAESMRIRMNVVNIEVGYRSVGRLDFAEGASIMIRDNTIDGIDTNLRLATAVTIGSSDVGYDPSRFNDAPSVAISGNNFRLDSDRSNRVAVASLVVANSFLPSPDLLNDPEYEDDPIPGAGNYLIKLCNNKFNDEDRYFESKPTLGIALDGDTEYGLAKEDVLCAPPPATETISSTIVAPEEDPLARTATITMTEKVPPPTATPPAVVEEDQTASQSTFEVTSVISFGGSPSLVVGSSQTTDLIVSPPLATMSASNI